jgi:membrane protein
VNGTDIRHALNHAKLDLISHHTLQVSAALSYYFILALFPGLIVLSALFGFIPVPDLFGWVLGTMARVLPPETMRTVQSVLADVLSAHSRAWLSLGMLGMLWVATAAFDALVEALNIAYDVVDERPFWKTRLLALGLAGICGALFLTALAVMIVGPRFGEWLAARMMVPKIFPAIWPTLHWSLAITFTVLGVELLYFIAPCVKQRFAATLPGAILTVVCWLGLSSLLGVYFRHFANYTRTYGTLAGFVAFMTWFQWTSFVLLVGAEINAELAKVSKKGSLPAKSPTPIVAHQELPNKAA